MIISICVMAVPAKRGVRQTLTLSDGTTISARLVGDEHGHYWLADNGRAYNKIDNAVYFTEVDAEAIKARASKQRASINARRVQHLQQQRRVGDFGNYFGPKKGIVILVNFSNVAFKPANNNELYTRIANEENFNEGSFKGSMYDYFHAQSGGLFDLTFDVFGPVTVSKTQSYYGSNDSQGNDNHPGQMVCEAVNLIKDDVQDWTQYDWDGDGWIDQVYVIYAGKGEADGGASSTIWPHAWALSSANYYGDGTGPVTVGNNLKVDTYACGSELMSNGNIEGIGTMCHEFSHCLGYPDFYDTDYSGGQGMDAWDLMDAGCYNGNGYQPAGYTSYERWVVGWLEPIELNMGTQQIENMDGLQNGGETYIIYNDGNRNEYFMLENRTKTGWDASLPGGGLLILHVDYNKTVWDNNQPNDDPSHQRMTWVPADGNYNTYSTASLAADLFPSGSNNSFSDTSLAKGELYNKNTDGTKLLHKAVINITKNTGTGKISFTYKGTSNIALPTFSPAAGTYTETQQVTINCSTEGATIYYTTDGSVPTTNSTIYTAPITVDESMTIKAIAASGDEESYVAEAKYTIKSLNPSTEEDTFVWKEDFSGVAAGTAVEDIYNPSAVYTGDGGTYCKIYNDSQAGGQKPELLIPNNTRPVNSFSVTTALGDVWGELPLSFKCNKSLSVTSETPGVTVTFVESSAKTYNYTITVPEGTQSLQLTFATKNSNNARIDNIQLLKPVEEEVTKIAPELAFNTTYLNAFAYEEDIYGLTLTNPYNVTVTYTSDNSHVAAVDANTGVLTIGREGEATITATFEGDDTYQEGTASYRIYVLRRDADLGFSHYELYAETGDEIFEEPELRNPHQLEVSFISSDKEIATVDEKTGKVTIGDTEGIVTIKAIFDGNEYYYFDAVSYRIIVTKKPEEVGIQPLQASEADDYPVYDMLGRRVAANRHEALLQLGKGLYICNGKKVVIK